VECEHLPSNPEIRGSNPTPVGSFLGEPGLFVILRLHNIKSEFYEQHIVAEEVY
jgi:hypothetical protein